MVLESARPRLSALAPIATELNASSDAFTEELKTVEAELAKLNPGVDVRLSEALVEGDLQEERDDDERLVGRYSFDTFLAYGKYFHYGWRLLVREYRVELDADGYVGAHRYILREEKPLVEASRELRIAAAPQLNLLLDAITEKATTKAAQLREVIDKK